LIACRKLRVNAKIVICSAGAIHTPAVLLRSGFKHPQIGRNMALHPVMGAGGLFPRDVDTGLGSGVSMGVVVRSPPITVNTRVANGVVSSGARGVDFEEEQAHTVAIETPPVHPGLLGLMIPWQSGKQFKMSCLGWRNFAIFIGIARDRSQAGNCVAINAQGQPVIRYKLVPKDAGMLQAGFEVTLRMLYAAGASMIFAGHENFPWFVKTPEAANDVDEKNVARLETENASAFETFLASVRKEGVQQSKSQIFSAHQMSSCRMAVSPREGCTRPSGELFECRGLYLADASILPTSLGINPMVTIESVAHMVAGKVVSRLREGEGEDEADMRDRLQAVSKAQGRNQW
jgi:long-chain-alcohol oxidase